MSNYQYQSAATTHIQNQPNAPASGLIAGVPGTPNPTFQQPSYWPSLPPSSPIQRKSSTPWVVGLLVGAALVAGLIVALIIFFTADDGTTRRSTANSNQSTENQSTSDDQAPGSTVEDPTTSDGTTSSADAFPVADQLDHIDICTDATGDGAFCTCVVNTAAARFTLVEYESLLSQQTTPTALEAIFTVCR